MFGSKKRKQNRIRRAEEASRHFREMVPQVLSAAFCSNDESLHCWDMFTFGRPAVDELDMEDTFIIALTSKAMCIAPMSFLRAPDLETSYIVPYSEITQCDHIAHDDWKHAQLPAHTLIVKNQASDEVCHFYNLGLPRNGVEELLVKIVRNRQLATSE